MSLDVVNTIETGVSATLRIVADQVVNGAGLALARGAAGIGKTFALEAVSYELESDGVNVVRVTASEVTGGSVSAFLRSILSRYGVEPGSAWEGVEELSQLLYGYPFSGCGPRAAFIVDEAQFLKPSVLETIRGLWDRGDQARLILKGGPAFGCLLVGNDTFLGKGGSQRIASFQPLLSRVTHDVRLPRPSDAEHHELAANLFPDQPELQNILSGYGKDRDNLRVQAVAARQAGLMAGGGEVSPKTLRMAIKFMGGINA